MKPDGKTVRGRLRDWMLTRMERPHRGYEQRICNNLDKLFDRIRPGDVVLVEGRSKMSRMIKLFSNSHWSHAALYVGDGLIRPGRDGRRRLRRCFGDRADRLVVEAFAGRGVVAAPLEQYARENLRICRPYGITTKDRRQVVENAIATLGRNYDNRNIADLAVMTIFSWFRPVGRRAVQTCLGNCNDFQVICSGMIAQAFQRVGYPIVPALAQGDAGGRGNPYGAGLVMRHYSRIMPRDFDLSPNFEIIKFNVVGSGRFDYKRLWVETRGPAHAAGPVHPEKGER